MVGATKGFSKFAILLAVVSYCSPAFSFILPRVSQTDDAIIVDCIQN
jgi:hypothetical protein